jgi:glucoamylase
MDGFEAWLEQEYRYAIGAMLRSVSAVDLVKTRPGFGQSVRPARGSVVASPVLAAYDPDPDYFFHWYRDSAVVLEALRLLHEDGSLGSEALAHVADFVAFNRSLQALDGRLIAANAKRREAVVGEYRKFVREDGDLNAVHGDAVAAETRVNPDGTLDITKWARPQHDGPPLRALALLRWARRHRFDAALEAELAALIRADLDFTLRHWREPSYDIWEEEPGQHYYTLRVSAAALEEGAAWLEARSDPAQAHRDAATEIRRVLDGFWLPEQGYYRSRVLASGQRTVKELDIAVILSAIHAEGEGEAHTVRDPRMQATLAKLEALFGRLYAINRHREAGPAMGRYEGDVYYSGGAYFFSTLGAAEFCFRAAAAGADDAAQWLARGDAYLATVRRYAGADGDLSEQFDQTSGAQTSARHLAWSYAAFISCIAARRAARG